MNFIEIKRLESVTFNNVEKMVYILIKNEVYKVINDDKLLISSTNERVSLPPNVSLDFLNEVSDASKTIDLIKYYWKNI